MVNKINNGWNLVRDQKGKFWMFNIQTNEKITEEEYKERFALN